MLNSVFLAAPASGPEEQDAIISVLARSAILPAVPIIFIMSRAPFAVHHRCKADPCPWEILRLGVFVIFIVAPAISAYLTGIAAWHRWPKQMGSLNGLSHDIAAYSDHTTMQR
jgi:hypothetical protein